MNRLWAIAFAAWLSFSLAGPASAQLPVSAEPGGKPTLAPLLHGVAPAVVNISVTGHTSVANNPLLDDPFFRRFFGVPDEPQTVPVQAAGSGVIVDADRGYVLTNNHVIEHADEVLVTLADRRQFKAQVLGTDDGTDIALLKIDASALTAIPFGDSDELQVGDFVVAIGNPFGLGQTVTSGIVSALGRSGLNVEGYEDFIQTDASINPGNSGGALISLDGKLIGINAAILSPGGGNVGIGFAVPSNMAHSIMDQLVEYGEVRRGLLGVAIQNLTPDLAKALEIPSNEGAVVTEVQPGSAAEDAGIMAGDVIVAVDQRPITSASDLRNRIGLVRAGRTVSVTLIRDGQRRTVSARISDSSNLTAAGGHTLDKLEGAEFSELDRAHSDNGRIEGVLVTRVEQGSPAWRNGLREDDIILGVNRKPVGSLAELQAALAQAGATFALNIRRGNSQLFIVVR